MENSRHNEIFLPFIICIIFPIVFMLTTNIGVIRKTFSFLLENPSLQSFVTIFISIILEALPFIIIGVFLSSLIQVFISEETLARIIPKNTVLGILFAATVGLIFPVCDCAIIPIVRRLLKKGLPLPIGVTFMLSVPIINPVVLTSTYYAFLNNPYAPFIRAVAGWTSAVIIGFMISKLNKFNTRQAKLHEILFKERLYTPKNTHSIHEHNHEHCHHDHTCSCGHIHHTEKNFSALTLVHVLEHVSLELQDVGRFVIMGAFLSALMQTFIPRKYILSIGHGNISSIIVMMLLAYVLCVCSETDAFIARTFVNQFTNGSIIAFLIFGPMIDIKNTLMLCETFNLKFVFKLVLSIILVCFLIGLSFNFLKIPL
ncbi:permease [Clostridium felsineum]|uniref:permease n=1 Tax=Clostridium felsineum TaxID=36839 RepID=UPI00098C0A38|nr:permease [Clostridium felsineum]URZ00458.1 Putative two-component membrane permease complex subunit SMU_747c [Clostridium felsineum]